MRQCKGAITSSWGAGRLQTGGVRPLTGRGWRAARVPDSGLDVKFMELALVEAQKAFDANEVPIGAVLVHEGEVVSAARNEVEIRSDPTAHAELLCIQKGAKLLGWRLCQSTLYATTEPCPMCAGAILQARIDRLVYGARSPRLGANGSWVSLLPSGTDQSPTNTFSEHGPMKPHPFHPSLQVESGIMEQECADILKLFFQQRRERNSSR